MTQYHKIQTVFLRNPEDKFKTLLHGEFTLPEFEYLKNNIWTFTEKVDGTNIRILYNCEDDAECLVPGFEIRGKTDKADIPELLEKSLDNTFLPLNNKFSELFGDTGVCLYGEGYGGYIQKGGRYRPDCSFVLFDIKIGHWWLKRGDIEDVAKKLGIDVVPIVGEGTLLDMVNKVSIGFKSAWNDNLMAEGIVARPKIELFDRGGRRIITKLKHKDF